jgi:acetoin utilization protein AcuB
MSRNLITVEPYCAIEEAARILRTRSINALPVLRAGSLVGIITESDIFDALLGLSGANFPGYKLVVESEDMRTALESISRLSHQHRMQIQNTISCHDRELPDKVVSAFQFTSRPDRQFVQELVDLGFRVLSIGS